MSDIININEIEEGMILAEPIVNSYGQTLINSGVVLSKNHIRLLKTWNIQTLFIKKDENEEEVEISNEMIINAQKKLAERVIWNPRNEIERDLHKNVVLYFAKKSS